MTNEGAAARLHEEAEAALEQRAVLAGEDDLVVALAPPRPLLEAVTDLLGSLTHCQILRHVAALRACALSMSASTRNEESSEQTR